MCLFICINPVLDIISFLYRNCFKTSFSPATVLRPIIPVICCIVLFFRNKHKKKMIIVMLIYAIYSIIHIYLFKELHNYSSYGNLINEIQYIVNYTFMVINLYLFYILIKDTTKLYKSVFISFFIYVVSLFVSIITKTSSFTYIEGIGYKGFFESGNSLCTILALSLCIILCRINLNDWKKITLIVLSGIYLSVFSGMRTGLFGFCIVIGAFIFSKVFIGIKNDVRLNKKQIIIFTSITIAIVILLFTLGSQMLARRKMLKKNEQMGIDEESGELRYVTGDILNLYKQIKNSEIAEDYMTKEEQNAVVNLCEYAEKIKLSNVNLRAQQFIYNVFLIKEQKSLKLILFGNGYKNQIGELVMEMEIPALICNFGVVGFILYFLPFLLIFVSSLYKIIKNKKEIDTEIVMYFTGIVLAILLSCVSGYVMFNFSCMTIAIILNILLSKKSKQKVNKNKPNLIKMTEIKSFSLEGK